MSTTVHRKSPPRGRSSYISRSHIRSRSPPLRRSHHRARSPEREKLHDNCGKFVKYDRSKAPHGARSPLKERVHDHARSSKHDHSRSPRKEKLINHRSKSPVRARSISPSWDRISRSPSPRTMRLRRAREDRETDQVTDRDRGRGINRGNENGRHKEHASDKEVSTKKRTLHDKSDRSSRAVRRDRSVSPVEKNHRSHYSLGSPSRSSKTHARDEVRRSIEAEQHGNAENDSVARMKAAEEALEAKQKEKPSFELSGKLAEETNRVRGVTLLFTEPADACKPDIRWRLYVFKAGEVLNEPLYVHRQSCYLFGRERRVADIPTDHPSCSKQHAVVQFRLVEKEQLDGMMKKQIRPYLMDLGSTNGTFINDSRVEAQRYYELFEKDTIRFGNSSREYVLLHENSV